MDQAHRHCCFALLVTVVVFATVVVGVVGVVGVRPVEAQEPPSSLTATPSSGVPGTSIVIGGVACCPGSEFSATLYWVATKEAIGTVTIATDGTATGSALIPVDAEDGTGYVSTCGPGTHDACTMTVAFTVELPPPSLVAEPSEVRPGDALRLSGEGWCCEGDAGAVTDLSTGQDWGTATVGPAGELTAEFVVPADALAGTTELDVCVFALCAVVAITILDASTTPTPAPPTPQGSAGPSPAPGAGSGGGSAGGGTAPDRDVFLPTEPTKHDAGPVAVVSAIAVLAVLALVIVVLVRLFGRRSRPGSPRPSGRDTPRARVLLEPDAGMQTIAGRAGPVLGICAVIDVGEGTMTIGDR